jgi:quercetin dioxygenase-like cupin family protein
MSHPTGAAAENATAPRGFSAKLIGQTTIAGTDYIVREVTLEPGGSTGWHYHDGPLYGLVRKGTFTRTFADCLTSEHHPEGTTVVEPHGPDHVHLGRNLGPIPVVLEVLYALPTGSPFAQPAPNPGCDFQ